MVSTTNSLEAVEYTYGQALDLIYVEIHMPEMDRLTANWLFVPARAKTKIFQ